MTFCTACGHRTVQTVPPGDNAPREVCPDCGFIHYENPKILVACILFEGEKLLWIKRAIEPYEGRWAIPAGFMERGETVQEAACRELLEETGLSLAPEEINLYNVLSLPELDQVYITYFAPLPSHDYNVTPETLEIALFTAQEVAGFDFAYPPETDHLIWQLYRELESGEINRRIPLSVEIRSQS